MNEHRSTAGSELADDYLALASGSARVRGLELCCVWVCGDDAASFLHSLCSQDIGSLTIGQRRPAYLLQPTGKVVAAMVVHRDDADRFCLEVEPVLAAGLAAQLNRFRIRVKATVSFDETEKRLQWCSGTSSTCELDDVLGSLPEVSPVLYEAWRIERAVPLAGRELTADTVPNELPALRDHVSFTKGCYLGQELVERIDSRGGNTPYRVVVVDIDPQPASPASVTTQIVESVARGEALELHDEGAKPIGHLTSAAWHPVTGRAIGLARLHRSVFGTGVLGTGVLGAGGIKCGTGMGGISLVVRQDAEDESLA